MILGGIQVYSDKPLNSRVGELAGFEGHITFYVIDVGSLGIEWNHIQQIGIHIEKTDSDFRFRATI